MSPIGDGHSSSSSGSSPFQLLDSAPTPSWTCGDPMLLQGQESEPQPDLSLLRLREDLLLRPALRHPKTSFWWSRWQILLFSYDRKVKMPLYAEAGIPEVLVGRSELQDPLRLPPSISRGISGRPCIPPRGVCLSRGLPRRAVHRRRDARLSRFSTSRSFFHRPDGFYSFPAAFLASPAAIFLPAPRSCHPEPLSFFPRSHPGFPSWNPASRAAILASRPVIFFPEAPSFFPQPHPGFEDRHLRSCGVGEAYLEER